MHTFDHADDSTVPSVLLFGKIPASCLLVAMKHAIEQIPHLYFCLIFDKSELNDDVATVQSKLILL